MTAPAASVAAVQQVLLSHQRLDLHGAKVGCSCGWSTATPLPIHDHAAHVAVAAADAAVQAARPSIERAAKAEALRGEAAAWRQKPNRSIQFSGALIAINIDAAADQIEAQP